MRYVQRNDDGNVIGHYANWQSYAAERLPAEHPDIVAFEEARQQRLQVPSDIEQLKATVAALEARLNDMEKRILP